jgi:hypothetical protein
VIPTAAQRNLADYMARTIYQKQKLGEIDLGRTSTTTGIYNRFTPSEAIGTGRGVADYYTNPTDALGDIVSEDALRNAVSLLNRNNPDEAVKIINSLNNRSGALQGIHSYAPGIEGHHQIPLKAGYYLSSHLPTADAMGMYSELERGSNRFKPMPFGGQVDRLMALSKPAHQIAHARHEDQALKQFRSLERPALNLTETIGDADERGKRFGTYLGRRQLEQNDIAYELDKPIRMEIANRIAGATQIDPDLIDSAQLNPNFRQVFGPHGGIDPKSYGQTTRKAMDILYPGKGKAAAVAANLIRQRFDPAAFQASTDRLRELHANRTNRTVPKQGQPGDDFFLADRPGQEEYRLL